jgi:hypothetical protein
MKKIYLIVFCCITFFTTKKGFAQTETDTTFFTRMNYIFAHVDKSKVPYGYVKEFVAVVMLFIVLWISGSYIVQITSGTLQEKHQLIIQN